MWQQFFYQDNNNNLLLGISSIENYLFLEKFYKETHPHKQIEYCDISQETSHCYSNIKYNSNEIEVILKEINQYQIKKMANSIIYIIKINGFFLFLDEQIFNLLKNHLSHQQNKDKQRIIKKSSPNYSFLYLEKKQ